MGKSYFTERSARVVPHQIFQGLLSCLGSLNRFTVEGEQRERSLTPWREGSDVDMVTKSTERQGLAPWVCYHHLAPNKQRPAET